MTTLQILLCAGTHGNEINAPWLLDHWERDKGLINTFGLNIIPLKTNPKAIDLGKRYLNRDLNRCFQKELINSNDIRDYEVLRAKEILKAYGPKGDNPCQIAFDLHSTTASMGSSIVMYGRRPSDLALASLIQSSLGLPIYLHEGDVAQQGFLVESWPCGLVFEIGPVPQGNLSAIILEKNRLILEKTFQMIQAILTEKITFPESLIVHRHIRSIDYPRNSNGDLIGYIHPKIQGNDWHPINKETPIFIIGKNQFIKYDGESGLIPVFVNEAAYIEKNIAMTLTKREVWPFNNSWGKELYELVDLVKNN